MAQKQGSVVIDLSDRIEALNKAANQPRVTPVPEPSKPVFNPINPGPYVSNLLKEYNPFATQTMLKVGEHVAKDPTDLSPLATPIRIGTGIAGGLLASTGAGFIPGALITAGGSLASQGLRKDKGINVVGPVIEGLTAGLGANTLPQAARLGTALGGVDTLTEQQFKMGQTSPHIPTNEEIWQASESAGMGGLIGSGLYSVIKAPGAISKAGDTIGGYFDRFTTPKSTPPPPPGLPINRYDVGPVVPPSGPIPNVVIPSETTGTSTFPVAITKKGTPKAFEKDRFSKLPEKLTKKEMEELKAKGELPPDDGDGRTLIVKTPTEPKSPTPLPGETLTYFKLRTGLSHKDAKRIFNAPRNVRGEDIDPITGEVVEPKIESPDKIDMDIVPLTVMNKQELWDYYNGLIDIDMNNPSRLSMEQRKQLHYLREKELREPDFWKGVPGAHYTSDKSTELKKPGEISQGNWDNMKNWEKVTYLDPNATADFQLPDGRIIKIREELARDANEMDYTLADGSIVKAKRVIGGIPDRIPPIKMSPNPEGWEQTVQKLRDDWQEYQISTADNIEENLNELRKTIGQLEENIGELSFEQAQELDEVSLQLNQFEEDRLSGFQTPPQSPQVRIPLGPNTRQRYIELTTKVIDRNATLEELQEALSMAQQLRDNPDLIRQFFPDDPIQAGNFALEAETLGRMIDEGAYVGGENTPRVDIDEQASTTDIDPFTQRRTRFFNAYKSDHPNVNEILESGNAILQNYDFATPIEARIFREALQRLVNNLEKGIPLKSLGPNDPIRNIRGFEEFVSRFNPLYQKKQSSRLGPEEQDIYDRLLQQFLDVSEAAHRDYINFPEGLKTISTPEELFSENWMDEIKRFLEDEEGSYDPNWWKNTRLGAKVDAFIKRLIGSDKPKVFDPDDARARLRAEGDAKTKADLAAWGEKRKQINDDTYTLQNWLDEGDQITKDAFIRMNSEIESEAIRGNWILNQSAERFKRLAEDESGQLNITVNVPGGGRGKPPKGPPRVSIPGPGKGANGLGLPPIKPPSGWGATGLWNKARWATDWINVPVREARNLMTTGDLSFLFRQGVNLLTRPNEMWKAGGAMHRAFASEESYDQIMAAIRNNPRFDEMKENGVKFTDLGENVEENLAGKIIEKFGWRKFKPIRMSNRAFTAVGNKFRNDVYNSMADDFKVLGVNTKGTADGKRLAQLVNDMTGRGGVGYEAAFKELNKWIFSPQFIASRVNMFRRAFGDPKYTEGMHPEAAKKLRSEAIKSMVAVGSLGLTSAGIASALGYTETIDPLSADFLKLKIGKTRYDLTGGYAPYIRTAAQLITGHTNRERFNEPEPGFGSWEKMNRWEAFSRFARNKFAPHISLISDWAAGTKTTGEPFTWSGGIKERTEPLIAQGIENAWRDDPNFMNKALAIPANIYGIGTQTYGPSQRSNSSGTPIRPRTRVPRIPRVQVP